MGQAKKRGTKEERVKMAIIRDVFRKTQETDYDDHHDRLRMNYYEPRNLPEPGKLDTSRQWKRQ